MAIQNWLFYGQPGSGKTTLAHYMINLIPEETMLIDGDDLRAVTSNQSYDREGRIKNVGNALTIAKYLNSKGISVIISIVAPYREMRKLVEKELPGTIIVQLSYDKTTETRGRENYWVSDYEYPIENVDTDICKNSGSLSVDQIAMDILLVKQKKQNSYARAKSEI